MVFVAGAEISLLNKGFLPGDTLGERMELLADLRRLRQLIAGIPARVNDFLGKAVAVVRERFGDTYPDMAWELLFQRFFLEGVRIGALEG